MDTTKTSNPSSDADGADDLIEELARLMADDAQINAPSPEPVAKNTPIVPTGSTPAATSQTATSQTFESKAESSSPGFKLKSFDLGEPKVETSTVQTPKKDAGSEPEMQPQNQSKDAANAPPDFDFGFGVAPEPALDETNQILGEPQSTDPISAGTHSAQVAKTPEPSDDPIADLINAAVSKHDNAPVPDDLSQEIRRETDDFVTPPVFGLEGTPTVVEPEIEKPQDQVLQVKTPPEKSFGGSVALDEIETLIGNSISVDTASNAPDMAIKDATGDMSAQMAVEGPPVTATTAPIPLPAETNIATLPAAQLDDSVDDNAHPDSAEAAILQAMAAAGTAASANAVSAKSTEHARVDKTGTAEPQLAPGRVAKPQKARQSLSGYLLPLLGILFVAVIGVGAYFWLNPGPSDAEAPILVADGAETRQTPEPAEQPAESVVLNQIDGTSEPAPEESLVSRDQTEGATGETIRQVITADNSEAGLANRRVRTVIVRPDGTIISGEDAVAGGQALPVDQPTLPDLPANAVNTELSNTTVAALPQSPAETVNVQTVTVNGSTVPFPRPRLTNRANLVANAAVTETQLPVTSGVTPSSELSAVNLISDAPAAPVVEVVTPTQPAQSSAPAEVVSIVETSTTAPVATSTVSNPRAFVQLASQRSQNTANTTARNLQSQYASQLNGGTLVVRRVDLGTRGIYFRVQLPTDTLRTANSICTSIKNAGGDCFANSI